MKKYLFCIMYTISFSCSSNLNNNEISFIKPKLIIDSIMMQMPGTIYVLGDTIIVEDVMGSEYFYSLYLKNGNFIRNIAQAGHSSIEFTMPNLMLSSDGNVIITDINKGNSVMLKNDSIHLIRQEYGKNNILKNSSTTNIQDNLYVSLNYNLKDDPKEKLFSIFLDNEQIGSFGEFPIKEKINNRHDIHQGFLGYNDCHLVFFSSMIPYYAIYKRNGNSFELIKDEMFGEFNYDIKNGRIEIEILKTPPVTGIALLKDYIVTQGNTDKDKQYISNMPRKEIRGRDFNRLPRSLFIYDYNYTLKKVISTETPILRIASNKDSNTLFIVAYNNSEFNVSSVEVN